VIAPATTPAPSPAPGLADVLECLRAVMAEERRAISRLDSPALELVTARKRSLCLELEAAQRAAPRPLGAELRRLLVRTQIELGASFVLLQAATEAVAAALGVEQDDCYDRAARRHATTRPLRKIAL
jgi:hypothetical protein